MPVTLFFCPLKLTTSPLYLRPQRLSPNSRKPPIQAPASQHPHTPHTNTTHITPPTRSKHTLLYSDSHTRDYYSTNNATNLLPSPKTRHTSTPTRPWGRRTRRQRQRQRPRSRPIPHLLAPLTLHFHLADPNDPETFFIPSRSPTPDKPLSTTSSTRLSASRPPVAQNKNSTPHLT